VKVAAIILGIVLAAGVVPAAGDQAMTREQALAALANRSSIDHRRLGAAWLGSTGRMDDVPALVEALRDPDLLVRALAEQSLWQVWSRSGDPDVDALFQLGLEQMTRQDAEAAIDTFSQIVQKKPEFAEGWNKRATLYYLVGEYEKSLVDCEEVIRRNPWHFGALSGFGLNYLKLGKPEQALQYFQRALEVSPNLAQIQAAVEELRQLLQQRSKGSI